MLKFMLIGAPRSGTAWAANWLTTGATLCLHDPLWDVDYRCLDDHAARRPDLTIGIACSGMALLPDWVNLHPARKVILHRPEDEVTASLAAIGLPPVAPVLYQNLERIRGMHVAWTDLFTQPKPIVEHLLGTPFDEVRHGQMRLFNVQSRWRERYARRNVEAQAAMQGIFAAPL